MDAEPTSPDVLDRRPRAIVLAAAIALVLSLGVLAALTVPRVGAAGGPTVLGRTVTASATTAPLTVDLRDGVVLDVHLPAARSAAPVLLYVHGGGWASGHRSDVPDELGVLELVERGWVVVSAGYRRADPATRVTAMDQADDVVAALEWIHRSAPELDLGGQVVAMGHSAGAHLVALSAARMPVAGRPDAVLLVSGVYDFGPDVMANPVLGPAAELALGCAPPFCATRSSLEPAAFADAGDPPVVIVHGGRDRIAPLSTATRYGDALDRAGVDVDVHVVARGRHLGDRTGAVARTILARWTVRSADG